MLAHHEVSEPEGSRELHPVIYGIIISLCLLLIGSIWGFAGKGLSDFALAVASIFIGIAVAIPVVLWRISLRRKARRRTEAKAGRFADWLAGDFEAWPGRQRGRDAAIEALLPIAAVALGMTLFALALHFTVSG